MQPYLKSIESDAMGLIWKKNRLWNGVYQFAGYHGPDHWSSNWWKGYLKHGVQKDYVAILEAFERAYWFWD